MLTFLLIILIRKKLVASESLSWRYGKGTDLKWYASLQDGNGTQLCGAALFTLTKATTSCHCVLGFDVLVEAMYPFDVNRFLLVASLSEADKSQERRVKRFIGHPKCSAKARKLEWHYDLGVIEVRRPFVQGPSVGLSQFLDSESMRGALDDMVRNGSMCSLVTYGYKTAVDPFAGYSNASLFLIDVRLLNDFDCFGEGLRWNRMCKLTIDTCTIDYDSKNTVTAASQYRMVIGFTHETSGGPLVCGGHVFGFLSYFVNCGLSVTPNVFTRLDIGYKFIMKASKGNVVTPAISIILYCSTGTATGRDGPV